MELFQELKGNERGRNGLLKALFLFQGNAFLLTPSGAGTAKIHLKALKLWNFYIIFVNLFTYVIYFESLVASQFCTPAILLSYCQIITIYKI